MAPECLRSMSNLRAHVSGEKALLSKVPPRGLIAMPRVRRPRSPRNLDPVLATLERVLVRHLPCNSTKKKEEDASALCIKPKEYANNSHNGYQGDTMLVNPTWPKKNNNPALPPRAAGTAHGPHMNMLV